MTADSAYLRPVLIAGRKDSGKTAYLGWLANRAKSRGWRVGGFLSLGEFEGARKARYYLLDIAAGEKRLLAWRQVAATPLKIGPYAFDPAVFKWAEQRIRRQMAADILMLDEYGPLEQRGMGFRPTLDFLLSHYRGILVITVRPALLPHLKEILDSGIPTISM